MDEILGLIVFVIFLFIQVMARSKTKKNKQKSSERPRSIPVEERQQAVRERDFRTATRDSYQAQEPPEVFPDRETFRKAINRDGRVNTANTQKVSEIKEEERMILTQKDLRRAILWSEVLGSPRAIKKHIR